MKPLRIVVFAKAPLPGYAKTRLNPALGPEGASALAARLLQHAVLQACASGVGPVELCVSPDVQLPVWQNLELPPDITWSQQGQGDLGQRLARAARRVLAQGESVLLMGTDCPGLDAGRLLIAAEALAATDACLAPVADGGYVLIGLNRFDPVLFMDIPWSSSRVASTTRERMQALGWQHWELPELIDIDTPEDLCHLPAGWLETEYRLGPMLAQVSKL